MCSADEVFRVQRECVSPLREKILLFCPLCRSQQSEFCNTNSKRGTRGHGARVGVCALNVEALKRQKAKVELVTGTRATRDARPSHSDHRESTAPPPPSPSHAIRWRGSHACTGLLKEAPNHGGRTPHCALYSRVSVTNTHQFTFIRELTTGFASRPRS